MNEYEKKIQGHEIHPYLEEICERLYTGHATVMVGAGFSKNSNKNFPDWGSLGDLFFKKIHGRNPNSSKNEDRYLNALKLADEVQAAFGRPALNQLIRSSIPDDSSMPSPLHKKLLELPWADIFTTNYDTLLERSMDFVKNQRFDVVVNKEDLLYAEKPRIIKLHGSFPSKRPFIITEEDYRTFPKEFAPFVNTVQQSLLENTLCLIGFSGDDPNFLQWIGWIRDNLGNDNAHKIYLIGIINLTDAQKKLLEHRNITVVDISIIDGINKNHYKALEFFIDYLAEAKKKYDSLDWPEKTLHFHPDPKKEKELQLQNLLPEWEHIRNSYPGWIVPSRETRTNLWDATSAWIDYISMKDNLPNCLDLIYAYELNWRLGHCLSPIFENTSRFYEHIIDKYSPCLHKGKTKPEKLKTNNKSIREMIISIMLGMLRFYREEGITEKWIKMEQSLNSISHLLSDTENLFIHYERVLTAFFKLDIQKVKEQLDLWPPSQALTYWEVRRAMIWAKIGEIDKAEKILDKSLFDVRKKLNLKSIINDYSLFSQEANIMLLIKYVKNAKRHLSNKTNPSSEEIKEMREIFFKDQNKQQNEINDTLTMQETDFEAKWNYLYSKRNDEAKSEWRNLFWKVDSKQLDKLFEHFKERWNYLKKYKCDPWNEIEFFNVKLSSPPIEWSSKTVKNSFDIGTQNISRNSRTLDTEASIAYQFLRFTEMTGFSINIPGSNISTKAATGAIPRIYKYSPYWSTSIMLSIGETKSTDLIFNRQTLFEFNEKEIDQFIDNYLHAIKNAETDIIKGNTVYNDTFGVLLSKIIPEILSRLSCKCSYDKKLLLLDFLKTIYGSEHKNKYSNIKSLATRLLATLKPSETYQLIPSILEIPFPQSTNIITETDFPNPFLFIDINRDEIGPDEKIKIDIDKINDLFELASSKIPEERKWGTFSLIKLFQLELLTQKQTKELAKVLWDQVDNEGFPAHTWFYKFAFDKLPHPKSVNPSKLLKDYIGVGEFPIQGEKNNIPMTGGNIPLCHEILGACESVDFSQQELLDIFNKLMVWWDTDKDFLQKEDSVFFSAKDEFTARFRKLRSVMATILPRIQKGQRISSKVKRLVQEFDANNIPINEVKMAGCQFLKIKMEQLIPDIKLALSCLEKNTVIDALEAISLFVKSTQISKNNTKTLLGILFEKICWQNPIALSSAINTIRLIIRNQPHLVNNNFEVLLQNALISLLEYSSLSGNLPETDFSQKLEIRKGTAALAYQYFVFLKKEKRNIPLIVDKWRNICNAENEFAEIKVQWKNSSPQCNH